MRFGPLLLDHDIHHFKINVQIRGADFVKSIGFVIILFRACDKVVKCYQIIMNIVVKPDLDPNVECFFFGGRDGLIL